MGYRRNWLVHFLRWERRRDVSSVNSIAGTNVLVGSGSHGGTGDDDGSVVSSDDYVGGTDVVVGSRSDGRTGDGDGSMVTEDNVVNS